MSLHHHRIHGLRIKSSPNLWVRLKFSANPVNTSITQIQRILFRDLGYLAVWLVASLLIGCSVKPLHSSHAQLDHLTQTLHQLDPTIPHQEADRLARDLYRSTAKLVTLYRLTRPPLWHNLLVNVGIKEKGLCYHFSDTLFVHLQRGDYPHFAFHLAVANKGDYFGEHNALLIAAKGKPITKGLIVDAWRHSGRLYVVPFAKDRYRWRHRAERCGCNRVYERCPTCI